MNLYYILNKDAIAMMKTIVNLSMTIFPFAKILLKRNEILAWTNC